MFCDHSLTLLSKPISAKLQKIELQISLCNSSKSSTIWNYWKSGFPRNPDFFRPCSTLQNATKMGIEKRNYRHNSTESPLLHAYNIDNFKWAVCLAWPLNKQTNKTNKWDTTAIPHGGYELFGLSVLRLNSQSEISAKNRSKPKYGHFASIVIEN